MNATGKSGSVVNVAFGAYFDNVTIPKIKLTINADPDTAIFGNTTDPILTIAAGAKVTINNLQFQDTFTSSSCIESRGSLTMHNIAVFLCSGMRGAAIHQIGGKLTITDSGINGNEATENGGCLAMEGGKLNLQNTDLTNCIAGGDGGALWLSNTKANIVGIGGEAHEPTLNIHKQPGVWFRRRYLCHRRETHHRSDRSCRITLRRLEMAAESIRLRP